MVWMCHLNYLGLFQSLEALLNLEFWALEKDNMMLLLNFDQKFCEHTDIFQLCWIYWIEKNGHRRLSKIFDCVVCRLKISGSKERR